MKKVLEFLGPLLSRKFLLTAAAFLTSVANGDMVLAVSVVLGYIGVQGVIDHKSK